MFTNKRENTRSRPFVGTLFDNSIGTTLVST
ncbi:hypothetical protein GWI33_023421, partial [Rhynchophorus ferrugineus]